MGKRKPVEYVILAGLVRKHRSGYDLSRWMQRETRTGSEFTMRFV